MLSAVSRPKLQIKIAFGYKMGVGKDEACSYLIKKYGGEKISFASPLYDIQHYAQKVCGFEEEKDRQFLQFIGTEWARKKDPDVWLNLAIKNTKSEGNFFLSDLRFPNELYGLKKEDWFCVNIVRQTDSEKRKGTGSSSHVSETALDNIKSEEWDYLLKNDGSIEEFYEKLDSLYIKVWRERYMRPLLI